MFKITWKNEYFQNVSMTVSTQEAMDRIVLFMGIGGITPIIEVQ